MEQELELIEDIELYKNGKGIYMLSSEANGIHLVLNRDLYFYLKERVAEIKKNNGKIKASEDDKGFLFLKKYGLLCSNEIDVKKKTTVDAEIFGRVLYNKKFDYCKQSKFLVYFMKLLLLISIFAFATNIGFFFERNIYSDFMIEYKAFDFQNIYYLLTVLFLIILSLALHEFGHVIFANYFKVFTKNITVSLYMGVAPMAYVKYRNIYKLSKAKRIIIYAGGIIMNLILVNFSLLLIYLTDWWVFGVALVINLLMVVDNFITFYKTDTYFMLCELFELGSLKFKVLKTISMLLNKELKIKDCFKLKDFVKIFPFFLISYIGAMILMYQILVYCLSMMDMNIKIQIITFALIASYYLFNIIHFLKKVKNQVYR